MSATHFSGPVVSVGGFTPGTSAKSITQIIQGTVAIDPASLGAATSAETAVTISGAATGDIVVMNVPPALEVGLVFSGARVSAANTVQVRLSNITAGAIDGANLTWGYLIVRCA